MRRRLGISATEWRGLPWWEQRALREGLQAEFGEGKPAGEDALADVGVTFN